MIILRGRICSLQIADMAGRMSRPARRTHVTDMIADSRCDSCVDFGNHLSKKSISYKFPS